MKNIIKSIVCVAIAHVTTLLLASFIVKHTVTDTYAASFTGELVGTIVAIVALIILHRLNVLKFSFRGFKEGLLTGGVQLFLATMLLIGFFVELSEGKTVVTATGLQIMFFLLDMLLVGVSEEVLFRGIIQNSMMDHFGRDSVGKLRKSIILASVIFGAIHLVNALSPNISISAALIQAVVAIPGGILFGAVYVRSSGNLWVGILLHAFNDAATFISGGGLGNSTQSEIIGEFTIVNLIPLVIYGIVDIWVLRKSKLEAHCINKFDRLENN